MGPARRLWNHSSLACRFIQCIEGRIAIDVILTPTIQLHTAGMVGRRLLIWHRRRFFAPTTLQLRNTCSPARNN